MEALLAVNCCANFSGVHSKEATTDAKGQETARLINSGVAVEERDDNSASHMDVDGDAIGLLAGP